MWLLFLKTQVRFSSSQLSSDLFASCISNIFESLINSSLVCHLGSFGFFSDHRYSFRKATTNLLLLITKRIHSCLDRNGVARAAVLDISKAFDRVWYMQVACTCL